MTKYVYRLGTETVYGDDPDTMVIEDGINLYLDSYSLAYKCALIRVLKAYIKGTRYVDDYLRHGRPRVTFVKFKSPWTIYRIEVTIVDDYEDPTCYRFFINKVPCHNKII